MPKLAHGRAAAVCAGVLALCAGTLPAQAAIPVGPARPAGWRVTAILTIPHESLQFDSVAADRSDDAWAVAEGEGSGRQVPTVLTVYRWRGRKWSRVPLPGRVLKTLGTESPHAVVGASSPANVWIFDDSGHWVRWNGRRWSVGRLPVTDSPAGAPGIDADLVLGPHDVWAFGFGLRGPFTTIAYAAHFDGRHWRETLAPGSTGISGASAVSPADIWTVTDGGVARWNGRSWRRVTLASKLGTGLLLDSVVARSDRNVWVAGLAANARGGNSGTAVHWNGAAWKSVQVGRPTSQTSTLASMVPDGHGGIWALNVPDLGSWQPWHFTGGRWLRAVTHIASPGQVTGMSSGLALVPGSTSVWGVGGRGAYPDGKGMIFLDGRVPR
jgi:hypothetical protein